MGRVQEFARGTKRYQTPDTYAKVLRLQSKTEEYRQFKDYLSLFFAFEQIGFPAQVFHEYGVTGKVNDPVAEAISSDLDYRYVQFIASVFDQLAFATLNNPPFRIITWNYDIQVEMILARILNCPISRVVWACNFDEQSSIPFISRLNGIAMLFNAEKDDLQIDYYITRQNIEGAREFGRECLDILSKTRIPWQNAMTFAWDTEHDFMPVPEIRHANTQSLEADFDLVIVGYSFPNFNRAIDRELLFNLMNKARTITYQDPNATETSLSTLFPSSIRNHCVPVTNKRQFYVPDQLLE